MPKISIVVPIYNSEKFLTTCIDSLVNQSLKDIEILLINDGSTDDSQKIVDEYVKKYPDMCKSFIRKNSGQAASRNFGINHSNGDYVFFVDSDDYLEYNACEIAYNYAIRNDLDILCFDFYEEYENKIEKASSYYFFNEYQRNKKYILNETAVWNKVIRRELLKKNKLFFMEDYIYEDLELIPRLVLYTNKIDFISEKLYHYVVHQNSTMRPTEYSEKMKNIFIVMDKLYENFKNTEYQKELEYIFIEHLLHAASLRFFVYEEGKKNIYQIVNIMKTRFPNWRKNEYYKKKGFKYRIICELFYLKKFSILNIILGGKNA